MLLRRIALSLVFLLPLPAFATFGAATNWDVKTTGLDTNGGGFDALVTAPGTDESQGSGTAITITLTGTTTGTGSPVFSSTTHGPGNFVHIASGSGCSTGWFEVLSQSAGTATFDHAMGVSTNVCVGTIGGSLLTNGQAFTNYVSKNVIWTQSGTYTVTSAITGSGTSSFSWIGYATTHGDNGTPPLITTATNSVSLFSTGAGVSSITVWFHNLAFSNTAGTSAIAIHFGNNTTSFYNISNCSFTGTAGIINNNGNGTAEDILNVYAVNNTAPAITGLASAVTIRHSFFVNNGGTGSCSSTNSQIFMASSVFSTLSISDSIVANGGGCGIYMHGTGGYQLKATNNTIANNAQSGILLDNLNDVVAGPEIYAQSNILYSNGAYGINLGSAAGAIFNVAYSNNNAVGANTPGNYNNLTSTGDVAITAGPFVNSGSGNYSLNTTAGGGAALRGTGFPGTFPGGTTAGTANVGAVQTNTAGGSGGGNFASAQ